ncbi:MAG: hypothetical protein ACK4SA_00870 [Caldilinea sp.]
MKRVTYLIIGLALVVLAAGAAHAALDGAQPIAQRATATPTPVLRIPLALTVLPLPVTIVVAPTSAITVTPSLTGTPTIRVTPSVATATPTLRGAPTRRATPTPTPRVRTTPTPTPTITIAPTTADDDATGIVDFRATTARVRGQIQLSWRYLGDDLDNGGFVVERSVNGGVWRFVPDCALPFDDDTELYRCRDAGLYSGSSYAYRICVAQDVPSCAGASVVETESIKAP